MSDQRPLLSMKKTFFYNFFPSKVEKEACKVSNTPRDSRTSGDKGLIPYPENRLENPCQIKKKITRDKINVRMLMIPFIQMFEYILRYWSLDMAKSLENNCRVCVVVWDVTEENVPKKYEGGSVQLRKLNNDDFSLWCIELFKDRRLSDGDEIGLYWDPRSPSLMFKLLSQVRA